MTLRAVVLITNTYPFATGEEFLEAEIGHLAAEFDEVVIVASQALPGPQTRALPPNTRAYAAGEVHSTTTKVLSVLQGLLPVIRQGTPLRPVPLVGDAHLEGDARRALAVLDSRHPEALRLADGAEVVVYAYWLHLPARVGMLIAERLRRQGRTVSRMVSRAHRFDIYEDVNPRGRLPLRPLLLGGLDGVYPVSDDGTRYIQQRYPQFADVVETRRLGTVDTGRTVEADEGRDVCLLTVSFCSPVKRLERMPAIVAAVREQTGADVRWTHIGGGTNFESLQELTARTLPDGVATFLGHLPHDQVIDAIVDSHAAVLVNLSESEGVPVTIMEACSLGMPVVATAVGGVAEIVLDGENGRTLDRDFADEDAVAALVALIEDPQLRAQMGRRSREVWARDYDADVVFPAFDAAL